jgi:hypothetical protein
MAHSKETQTGYIKNTFFDAINMFRCDYTDCKQKEADRRSL